MSHKKKAKPLADMFSGFQSNEDRKKEQRGAYHREYDGPVAYWMKSGHVPPKKSGSGRAYKGPGL